jgi:hypothetical protein
MPKREPEATVYVTESGEIQLWVKMPLLKGWIAAYWVVFQGLGSARRARIAELRVTSPSFLDPLRKGPVTVPRANLSFDAVRRHITEREFQAALTATVDWLTGEPFMRQVAQVIRPVKPMRRISEGRGAGRPGRPRSFYAKFANRYHEIENDQRREPGASTHATLAKEYDVAKTTIAKWIRIARQQELITKARRRGERGGMSTAAARALLRGGK